MFHRRFLRPGIVGPTLAWALLLGLIPQAADGAALPPAASGSGGATANELEARLVAAHLVSLGVSPAEAAARVATLPDAERHALASRLGEIGVGGSPAAALGLAFVVVALAILFLEMMGRRVVSRP